MYNRKYKLQLFVEEISLAVKSTTRRVGRKQVNATG